MSSLWTTPDARRLLIQAMADDALLKAVEALRSAAPDYLTGLLRAGHDEGRPEADLRAMLLQNPDTILAEAEPTWGLLVSEATRRGLKLPPIVEGPSDTPLSEVDDLLKEIEAFIPARFPVPFYEIQAVRASRTLLGHPLLPLSWVDLMRRLPGFRLGGLRIFAPSDAAISDPEIQVHKDLVVFGRSGKDLLHAYGKSGRCYVLPREAAQKGKVRQARLVTPGFTSYLKAVIPPALTAQRQRSTTVAIKHSISSHISCDPSILPKEDVPQDTSIPPTLNTLSSISSSHIEQISPSTISLPATESHPTQEIPVEDISIRQHGIPTSETVTPADVSATGANLDPDLAAALASPSEPPVPTKPAAPSAEARRKRSEAMLERWRLSPPPLPAGLSDEEAILRPAGAVAWRALCLMTLLAWASGFSLADEARAVGVPDETVQHVFGQEVARRLTTRERMFLAADPPSDAEREAMSIKAESLAVLLRALGILKRLPMPNEDVDPALVFNLGFEVLVRAGKRPPLAITESAALDLRDFYQRLHWIQRMAQLRGQKVPAGLRGDVLRERRHALEWLVTSYETGFVDWDRVDIGLPLPVT